MYPAEVLLWLRWLFFLKVDFLPIVVLVFVLSHNWLAISRGIFPVKILLCLFAQNFGDFQG